MKTEENSRTFGQHVISKKDFQSQGWLLTNKKWENLSRLVIDVNKQKWDLTYFDQQEMDFKVYQTTQKKDWPVKTVRIKVLLSTGFIIQ